MTGGHGYNTQIPAAGISEMPIGSHEYLKLLTLCEKTGRVKRRDCSICKMKTQFICSNVLCKAVRCSHAAGTFRGIPLCLEKVRHEMEEYGGAENTRTCMEIHKDNVRRLKADELKERYAARLHSTS